jgi:hypothetical protein
LLNVLRWRREATTKSLLSQVREQRIKGSAATGFGFLLKRFGFEAAGSSVGSALPFSSTFAASDETNIHKGKRTETSELDQNRSMMERAATDLSGRC